MIFVMTYSIQFILYFRPKGIHITVFFCLLISSKMHYCNILYFTHTCNNSYFSKNKAPSFTQWSGDVWDQIFHYRNRVYFFSDWHLVSVIEKKSLKKLNFYNPLNVNEFNHHKTNLNMNFSNPHTLSAFVTCWILIIWLWTLTYLVCLFLSNCLWQ